MKKQKLIEKINKIAIETPFPKSKIVDHLEVIKLIEQLDEQKPVEIPQFVADWIEEARKTCRSVADLFDFDFTNEEVGKWFMQERPYDLVARAWLDGYEVEKENEKEKRYCIVVKHTDRNCLKYDKYERKWYFGIEEISSIVRKDHTRKELEDADFGWVFDCEGIEIEEVE
mgnify:CR=1 FL=1|jgi:hypothetical protein